MGLLYRIIGDFFSYIGDIGDIGDTIMAVLYLSHTHSCDIKMPPLGEPKILCTSYSETASKEYRVSQKNWTKLGAIVVLADKLINIAPNFVQFFWDSLCSLYY